MRTYEHIQQIVFKNATRKVELPESHNVSTCEHERYENKCLHKTDLLHAHWRQDQVHKPNLYTIRLSHFQEGEARTPETKAVRMRWSQFETPFYGWNFWTRLDYLLPQEQKWDCKTNEAVPLRSVAGGSGATRSCSRQVLTSNSDFDHLPLLKCTFCCSVQNSLKCANVVRSCWRVSSDWHSRYLSAENQDLYLSLLVGYSRNILKEHKITCNSVLWQSTAIFHAEDVGPVLIEFVQE
jgi:hypothetical protein